jgi:hypothetical protein
LTGGSWGSASLQPRLYAGARCAGLQCTTLEKTDSDVHTVAMSDKQIVEDLLQRIPEDASLHDIAREIEFIAAVRQGLDEIYRGDRIPIEEVARELPSWIIR